MNKKTIPFKYKLILDIAMVIVLALLFRKNTFGIAFHEIAGLCVLAVFIIHVVLNRKWVSAITGSLFTKKTTIRAKICWLIDFALVITFILIGVSGILMSKVIFHFNIQGNWKVLHYFCSALALILTGVHLGMHGAVIGHSISRSNKCISAKASACIFGIISLAIVVFGAYSLTTTSFSRWITMPFESEMKQPSGNSSMPDKPSDIANDEQGTNQSDSTSMPKKPSDMKGGDHGNMPGSGHDDMQQRSIGSTMLTAIMTFLQFFSIMYIFAAITCIIDFLIMRKRNPKAGKKDIESV